jgi:hypothetical protein
MRDSSVLLHVSPHTLYFSQPLEIFTLSGSEDVQGALVWKSDKHPVVSLVIFQVTLIMFDPDAIVVLILQ